MGKETLVCIVNNQRFDGYIWWLFVVWTKVNGKVICLCRVSREPSKQNVCIIIVVLEFGFCFELYAAQK